MIITILIEISSQCGRQIKGFPLISMQIYFQRCIKTIVWQKRKCEIQF